MTRKPRNLKTFLKTIKVDPQNPRPEFINQAARMIKDGGIVAFPTRYLYGLGADALNHDAVDRIFEIKKRSHYKPILILIHQQEDLARLAKNVSANALQIMNHFWPGEITVVVDAADMLPQNLTAGSGKIGVRLPQHPVAVALVKAVQGPITATSANLAGKKGCARIDDLDPRIAERLDIILDAGPLKGGIGSTIVDVTIDPPVILREGAVSAKDIFAIL